MIPTSNVSNSPGWVDLGTPDVAKAAGFYSAVFNWSAQDMGEEAGHYTMLSKNDKVAAAVGPFMDERPDAVTAWTMYIRVADADATTKAVERAGGTVRVPPMDVMTAGRMACLTDPTGAEFNIWQPGDTVGFGVADEPESICWFELSTHDPERAKAFYGSVFDWNTTEFKMGDGASEVYEIFSHGPGEQDAHGGIAPIGGMNPVTVPRWTPYFDVENADATAARATAAGGTVVIPPTDIPPGRMAYIADPAGAQFYILKAVPMS
jgi:uncharacterized protein